MKKYLALIFALLLLVGCTSYSNKSIFNELTALEMNKCIKKDTLYTEVFFYTNKIRQFSVDTLTIARYTDISYRDVYNYLKYIRKNKTNDLFRAKALSSYNRKFGPWKKFATAIKSAAERLDDDAKKSINLKDRIETNEKKIMPSYIEFVKSRWAYDCGKLYYNEIDNSFVKFKTYKAEFVEKQLYKFNEKLTDLMFVCNIKLLSLCEKTRYITHDGRTMVVPVSNDYSEYSTEPHLPKEWIEEEIKMNLLSN